jgi:hypothetical protein
LFKDWQRARTMQKGEERTELFQQTFVRFEFFASSLQKYAERGRATAGPQAAIAVPTLPGAGP